MDDIEVAPLKRNGRDLCDAAIVAARAFHDDPFFEYLEPHAVRRARGLALFFRSALAGMGATGHLLGGRKADGRLGGVAATVPPGGYPFPVRGQVRQLGGALRAMMLRPRSLVDGSRYLLAIDRAHPKTPMWYLFLLASDPLAQRRGIGTALQETMLEAADGDGVECYLETQKEANLAYYRRFGYEIAEELRPVPKGPPLWTMRRPAS